MAPYREESLLQLIEMLYQAALDHKQWIGFLNLLSQITKSPASTIVVENSQNPSQSFGQLGGPKDPTPFLGYSEHWINVDVRLKAFAGLPVGTIAPEAAFLDRKDYEASEIYNDYYKPHDLYHVLGIMLFKDNPLLGTISIQRARKDGPFGKAEIDLCTKLFPHMQRAIQISQRLSTLQSQWNATIEILESIPKGIILIDYKGKIRIINRMAREIIKQNDGLTIRDNKLISSNRKQTNALNILIDQCRQTSLGNGLHDGGVLLISRPSLCRPLHILVTPLISKAKVFGPIAENSVAIFVSDPELVAEADAILLEKLLNLTPAEALTAKFLMEGKTTIEISELLRVQPNTVRIYFKRLFNKTETNRQAELVHFLFQSVASLRQKGM